MPLLLFEEAAFLLSQSFLKSRQTIRVSFYRDIKAQKPRPLRNTIGSQTFHSKHIMKTKLIFLAVAALWSAQAQAQMEIVESNVTIALKVHEQEADLPDVGGNNVNNYKIRTIKTADVIQMIAAKENIPIAKNARLILQQNFNAGGWSGYSFRIREPGNPNDIMVTNYLERDDDFRVVKSKISTTKGTGSESTLAMGEFDISLTGDFEGFYMDGPTKTTMKYVASKNLPGVVLSLETYAFTGAGQSLIGLGGDAEEGFVSGIVKISGSKIIK